MWLISAFLGSHCSWAPKLNPRSDGVIAEWVTTWVSQCFILRDIVDPRTESNPNPEPNPNPNPKPNPDPNCGFTISHKMKYLRPHACIGITQCWLSNLELMHVSGVVGVGLSRVFRVFLWVLRYGFSLRNNTHLVLHVMQWLYSCRMAAA